MSETNTEFKIILRFVLEHKIDELRQQILPKEGVIMDLRSQIEAMEDELVNLSNLMCGHDFKY